ncbi:MAG: AAA family ATPase [archaeon]
MTIRVTRPFKELADSVDRFGKLIDKGLEEQFGEDQREAGQPVGQSREDKLDKLIGVQSQDQPVEEPQAQPEEQQPDQPEEQPEEQAGEPSEEQAKKTPKEKIKDLKTQVMILEAEIDRMKQPPFATATVVELGEKTVKVAIKPGENYEVLVDPEMKGQPVIGRSVILSPKSHAIIGYSEFQPLAGNLAIVEEVIGKSIRASIRGETRMLVNAVEGVKAGDQVMLDSSDSVAVVKTDSKKTKYNLEEIPDAPWSNVAGLDDVIANIRAELEEPFKYKEVFAKYGRKPVKGVLLFGPPGCGKTMIARSIAYNLSQLDPDKRGVGQFISVKGPEILDKWVGNSEANIRRIYAAARETAEETGAPVVVFIDEAESVLKKRGSGISTDVYDSIVPQFLAELDGINGNGNVITVLATNRQDILDPAVVRDGRIDRRIKVPRPNKEGCKQIFSLYLNGKPFAREGGITGGRPEVSELSTEIATAIYNPENIAYNVVSERDGTLGSFGYNNLISGAMIKGIVDRATGIAIRREIDFGKKTGLTRSDLESAVQAEFNDNIGFAQALVLDDWESVFGARGRKYQSLCDQGYLTLERAQDQLNLNGGKND